VDGFRGAFVQTIASKNKNAFSSACHWHCSALAEQFTQIQVHGVSLQSSLLRLWEDPGSGGVYVDDCNGYDCSTNCPPNIPG